MKYLAFTLALLVSQLGGRYASESQALTRAAPAPAEFTTTASLGVDGLVGFRISVCAEATRTLSGAGTLQAYLLDEHTGLVQRNNDLDLSVDASGVRCQAFPDFGVHGSRAEGRVIFAANGVTVSGGSTVTVRYTGYSSKGDL